MKANKFLALLFAVSILFSSCATHVHTIGSGAQSSAEATQKKQWYALFGLVPITSVDTKEMAGDATNYTIKTEQTFVDGLISAIAGIVTINVRTVEVKK